MSKLTPGKEYEKKFLVRVNDVPSGLLKRFMSIEQGYLCLAPQVRIRLMDGEGILEMKADDNVEIELGRVSQAEGSRLLREYASKIASIISKERYVVPTGFDGLYWEIDCFMGQNEGLVMAELEMPRKNYVLKRKRRPKWLGDEVTDDPRFKNKNLAVRPFLTWPEGDRKQVFKLMGV